MYIIYAHQTSKGRQIMASLIKQMCVFIKSWCFYDFTNYQIKTKKSFLSKFLVKSIIQLETMYLKLESIIRLDSDLNYVIIFRTMYALKTWAELCKDMKKRVSLYQSCFIDKFRKSYKKILVIALFFPPVKILIMIIIKMKKIKK